jgi:hypothetical protein
LWIESIYIFLKKKYLNVFNIKKIYMWIDSIWIGWLNKSKDNLYNQ